jgi:hypothetical protein
VSVCVCVCVCVCVFVCVYICLDMYADVCWRMLLQRWWRWQLLRLRLAVLTEAKNRAAGAHFTGFSGL